MSGRRPARGPQRRAVVTWAPLLAAGLLLACETPQPQAEFAEEEPSPAPEDIGEPTQQACSLIEERIGHHTALADEPVDALTDVPELAWVASALATPELQDERDRAEGLIVFAPWDGEVSLGTPAQDEAPDGGEEPRHEGTFDGRSFVHLGEPLEIAQLVELGQIDLADGTTLSITQDDDGRVFVERDGVRAEVICADVPVEDGMVHVIDELLLPDVDDEPPVEPEGEVDHEVQPPETTEDTETAETP